MNLGRSGLHQVHNQVKAKTFHTNAHLRSFVYLDISIFCRKSDLLSGSKTFLSTSDEGHANCESGHMTELLKIHGGGAGKLRKLLMAL